MSDYDFKCPDAVTGGKRVGKTQTLAPYLISFSTSGNSGFPTLLALFTQVDSC